MAHLFRTRGSDGNLHPKWRFQYTDWKGRRHTKTGSESRQETEKLAQRVEAYHEEIRRGFRPAPTEAELASTRPYNEVANEYLAWGKSQGGRKGRSWSRVHTRNQQGRLMWWEKHLKLETLAGLIKSLPRVEKGLRDLQEGGASGKTLNDYAGALHAFCNWCIDRDYLAEDPLKRIKRFDSTPREVRRAVNTEEIMKLMKVAPEYRRLLYETAFCSGLRAKELRSLTVGDLDTRRGGLVLHSEWTKNRQGGFQPLPSIVVQHLQEFVQSGQAKQLYKRQFLRKDSKPDYPEEPLLFVSSQPSRSLMKDLSAAGIPFRTDEGKIDFHALRVAYVSFVLETGADLKTAQSLARHMTPELTMNVYAKVRGSHLTQVAEAVGRLVLPFTNIKSEQQNYSNALTFLTSFSSHKQKTASIPAASTSLRLERSGKRRLVPRRSARQAHEAGRHAHWTQASLRYAVAGMQE
jgi:integrase